MLMTQAQPAMPPLTEAMRAVLRNENDIYGDEDALYAALCDAAGAQPVVNQQMTTEREAFDQWFCREKSLPADADTTQYDEAYLPYRAWKARAALAQQQSAQGSPKRRPYNPSGSLSEYGVFPECDAAPVAAQAQPQQAENQEALADTQRAI